jgi:DNA-binding XRE family transcriptional regulator
MVMRKLRQIFQAWRIVAVATLLEALRAEHGKLQEKLGKQAESIWRMKKEELVEVARRELGLTQAQAASETVLVLRERIRAHRQQIKLSELMTTNPDTVVPKGLQRMTHAELVQEAVRRGLEMPASETNRPAMTRAQLIIWIQDHVKATQEMIQADWCMEGEEGRQG